MTLESQFLPKELASNEDLRDIMKDVKPCAYFVENTFGIALQPGKKSTQVIDPINGSILVYLTEFVTICTPTWTSDELFKALPERVQAHIMARLHDDPIYLKLDSKEEKLDNALKGSIDLHGSNFLQIWYEILMFLRKDKLI